MPPRPLVPRTLLRCWLAAVLLAVASTVWEQAWRGWIPADHGPLYGLLHGMSVFALLGASLGAGARRGLLWGVLGGLGIGLLAAGSFYVFYLALSPLLPGRPAYVTGLLLAWLCLWLLFAAFAGFLLEGRARLADVLLRALHAALLPAPAYILIIQAWAEGGMEPAPAFGCWLLAFLPACAVLMLGRGRTP